MKIVDASVRRALTRLGEPAKVTGQALAKAIITGTNDKDGQAAGREYSDFVRYAKAHDTRLTAEARAVMSVYTRYAKAARARGETGLTAKAAEQLQRALVAAARRPERPPPMAPTRLERVLANPNSVFKRQGYHPKYNPRPDERHYDGRNGNCGPTSLAMAVKAFGLEQARVRRNPEDSIDLARNAMTLGRRWNTLREPVSNDVGTNAADYARGARRLGLKQERLSVNHEHPLRALDQAFRQGRMVLLGGQPGRPGTGYTAYEQAMRHRSGKTDYAFDRGHAILVMGKDKQGRYLVADPLSRNGVVHMSAKEMASFKQWYGVEVWR